MNTLTNNTRVSIFKDRTLYYSHSITDNPYRRDHGGHTHDVCELLYVKSGDVSYTVKGRTYRIKEHDLILSRASEIHSITFDGNSSYERYDLLFDEKTLPFDIRTRIPMDVDVMNIADHEILRSLFEKMDIYCARLCGAELKFALTNLVSEIFINLMLDAKANRPYENAIENPTVARAVVYIDENISTIRDLDELCTALYITKSHLHHLFVEHMKTSPKKYITSKRLDWADRELSLGFRPTEVYLKCGFSDYSSFYRAYTRCFGHPPSMKKPPQSNLVTLEDLMKRGE